MIMKLNIERIYIVLKVEEKKTVNLYTLVDAENGDKIVSIGVKEADVKELDLVNATITFKSENERINTGEGVKYVEVLNTFVAKVSKVKK